MATVYVGVAEDDTQVAVKVIKAEYAQNKEFLTMFMDEGRLASRLFHPNIVRVLQLGEEDGRLYMAMELLRGQSLHALWDATRKHEIPVTPEVIAYLGAEVAAALHHAHDATDESGKPLQIVHRDVNPSNVLVSYSGEVKVIDFGLAKAVNRSSQTAAGIVKGKIAYLSPEQVSGKPLDRRADLFSLGTTLWEVSLNRRLFKGETKLETIHKIHKAEVPDPLTIAPGYPVLLWSVLRRCLMRLPAERFETAHECEVAFREVLAALAPDRDMKAEVAALMVRAFGEDKAKQEAWLEDASRATAQPLPTLRPMAPAQPASDSSGSGLSLKSGDLTIETPESSSPNAPPRSVLSSPPPPLPAAARSSSRSTAPTAGRVSRTSWAVPIGIVLVFLVVLAAGAFLLQRRPGR